MQLLPRYNPLDAFLAPIFIPTTDSLQVLCLKLDVTEVARFPGLWQCCKDLLLHFRFQTLLYCVTTYKLFASMF